MRRADTDIATDLPDGPLDGEIAGPPDDAGAVYVRLPALDDGERLRGPLPFPPRPDDVEPTRGDPCCVLVTTGERYWIAAWTPAP